MTEYRVMAYVNVDRDNFSGLHPSHPIALVGVFRVKATSARHAAECMFTIGNRMGCDLPGNTWPADVRSVSVGDLLKVITPHCHAAPTGDITFYACESVGWSEVVEPVNPVVALAGTRATSRV